MRITKRTNIAMRILMYCGAHEGQLSTKTEIAECCNVSESHLAQVVNNLAQLGYLYTQRGRHGGIRLAQEARDIQVGTVFRQVEKRSPAGECFADVDNSCPLIGACRLQLALASAVEAFYQSLDGLTLKDLICDNFNLLEILHTETCAKKP